MLCVRAGDILPRLRRCISPELNANLKHRNIKLSSLPRRNLLLIASGTQLIWSTVEFQRRRFGAAGVPVAVYFSFVFPIIRRPQLKYVAASTDRTVSRPLVNGSKFVRFYAELNGNSSNKTNGFCHLKFCMFLYKSQAD